MDCANYSGGGTARLRRLAMAMAVTACATAAAWAAAPPAPPGYETIKWESLVPKDWDPAKAFRSLDLSKLQDSDPKAMEALQSLRKAWDDAPVEPSMHGRKVRLPGFVLPLDQAGESLKRMLLVPYFGACIHTPPPPSNQIVQVDFAKPQSGLKTMDPVWVSGTLEVFRSDSPWGAVGYRLKAVQVVPYGE